MIDLIPELIQHIISFMDLEECSALLCIKPWAEVITANIIVLIDKTLVEYGSKFGQIQQGEHIRKTQSANYCSYLDDLYEQNPLDDRRPHDISSVTINSNYTLEIFKHDKKLYEDEFRQYVEMWCATKGYLYPYVVESPCMVMESRDPQDKVEEFGETQGYQSRNYTVYYPDKTWQESEELASVKKEHFFRVLRMMDLIKVDVYSMENGTRYENGFDYQIFFLMPDGTTFYLDLHTDCTEERYEMYNE
jgi:hypothetical protein